jgi:TolA-binding protein
MLAVGAQAQGSRWDSLRTYFKHLKQGLMESSVEGVYQKRGLVAVAAVRGAGQGDERSDPGKPGMKNPAKEKKIKVRKAEARELEKAVDLAVEGKYDEALAAMEKFEKAHPKSALLSDAKEAKGKVREAAEAQKAEGGAPAEPVKAGQ